MTAIAATRTRLGSALTAILTTFSPAAAQVDSVPELLALETVETEARIEVAGYHRPGDGGGGLFRYVTNSTAVPDSGLVLKPDSLPGLFVRQVPPGAEPAAEWFGAWGDGRHPDQAAINACLKYFSRVKLLAKTYALSSTPSRNDPNVTYHSINLRSGYRIEGSGRDLTLLRLLDGTNPRGDSNRDNYFAIMRNLNFHEPADHLVISDLTIDANFDGQNKHSTIHAIHIRGGNALVQRINFRGYGTGWHPESDYSRECFVVSQTLVYKHPFGSRKAATFRDLDFTAPGHNGMLKGRVAEITLIALGGAANFSDFSWIMRAGRDPQFDPSNGGENRANWWPSEGGLVEDCRIHDMTFDPRTQKSVLHGITVSNSDGVEIRNNRVENFDGSAFYTMSWHNTNTFIHHNLFTKVAGGVSIHALGEKGTPVQFPQHQGYRIEHNRILLGTPQHAQWPPCGIQLYGGDNPPGPRLVDIVAKENYIEGHQFLDAGGNPRYPLGISIQVMRDNLKGVRFENNVVEVPDVPATGRSVPRAPYGLALRYFPLSRWNSDRREGKITFSGNRTEAGTALRPSLANWSYNNAPLWGNPDGTTTSVAPLR